MDSFLTLKQCAADYVGGRNKTSVLEAAGRGIIEGIDRFNARHLVDFGSETEADAALVDGTNTVALATNFFAVRDVRLIDSDGIAFRVDYMEWEEFNRRQQDQTDTGRPLLWTAKNTFDDAQIILWPTPDASAAADYTIRLNIFTRVGRPNNDSDIISAPRELGPALCWYGAWKVLGIKRGVAHNDTMLARREWENWFGDFLKSQRRRPAATEGAFIDWDTTGDTPGDGVYVKLG